MIRHAARSLSPVFAAWALSLGCGQTMLVGELDGGGPSSNRPSRPAADECGNGMDDDSDGRIDEGCFCAAGESQSCFRGSLANNEVGECRRGNQTCSAVGSIEFGEWGECAGDIVPDEETCDGRDRDCDGAIDEGCPCSEGETRPCGDARTMGACRAGSQRCEAGTWLRCEGAVFPSPERCDDGIDNDCDGTIDDPSVCDCRPEPERCDDGVDNDCDGTVDEPDACRSCVPEDETCGDGTDQDCDARIDEGCEPDAGPARDAGQPDAGPADTDPDAGTATPASELPPCGSTPSVVAGGLTLGWLEIMEGRLYSAEAITSPAELIEIAADGTTRSVVSASRFGVGGHARPVAVAGDIYYAADGLGVGLVPRAGGLPSAIPDTVGARGLTVGPDGAVVFTQHSARVAPESVRRRVRRYRPGASTAETVFDSGWVDASGASILLDATYDASDQLVVLDWEHFSFRMMEATSPSSLTPLAAWVTEAGPYEIRWTQDSNAIYYRERLAASETDRIIRHPFRGAPQVLHTLAWDGTNRVRRSFDSPSLYGGKLYYLSKAHGSDPYRLFELDTAAGTPPREVLSVPRESACWFSAVAADGCVYIMQSQENASLSCGRQGATGIRTDGTILAVPIP